MRIKRSDNERLVVVHFPLLLAVAGLAPALISLVVIYGTAAGRIHWAKGQPIWSSPACVVLFALLWGAVFSIFVRKNTFNFDLVNRQLAWTRRSIYGTKAGIMPFSQIKGAIVETFCSGEGGPSYRPALSTDQGTFPLMNYYAGGTSKTYERIVAAINAALQTNPVPAMEEKILELATSGQWVAAIEMTRKRYGYDLAQAKQFVDGLTKQAARERDRG